MRINRLLLFTVLLYRLLTAFTALAEEVTIRPGLNDFGGTSVEIKFSSGDPERAEGGLDNFLMAYSSKGVLMRKEIASRPGLSPTRAVEEYGAEGRLERVEVIYPDGAPGGLARSVFHAGRSGRLRRVENYHSEAAAVASGIAMTVTHYSLDEKPVRTDVLYTDQSARDTGVAAATNYHGRDGSVSRVELRLTEAAAARSGVARTVHFLGKKGEVVKVEHRDSHERLVRAYGR